MTRSPTGENHGRDSRPGDVWHEPGDITDTDRLNWLIAGGYCPAEWRPATREELRAGWGRDNGQIMIGLGDRRTIDTAMLRASSQNAAYQPRRGDHQ